MADFSTTARPYAHAIYELAAQQAKSDSTSLQSWADALANLATVVSNAQVKAVLDNPDIGQQRKAQCVVQILGDNLTQPQQNLVRLMAENARLKIIPVVAEQYAKIQAQAENKIEAEVISAFDLTAEQCSDLTHTLKNKLGCDITLSTSVDKSLIGGVVIKAGDTIIDASMKSQLETLALSLGR